MPELYRIVIADDNIDDRLTLKHRLNKMGRFEIHEAADGAAAVAFVGAYKPHVVFMDWMMPNVSGWEAVRHLRRMPEFQYLPIIGLIPSFYGYLKHQGIEAGCTYVLEKPIHDVRYLVSLLEWVTLSHEII